MSTLERVAQRRGAERTLHEARVSSEGQRKYSEEYGLWMTPESRGMLDEGTSSFESAYGGAKGDLESAKAMIAKERGSLDSKWGEVSKGFVKVNVVDGDSIENSYFLPQEAVDKMNGETFNKEGSYTGNYNKDGSYNVDVKLATTGEKYGKELHEGLGEAQEKVKSTWYETNGAALKDLTDKYSRDVADAEGALEMQRAQHEGELADLKKDQQKATERAREGILSVSAREVM